jgi:hypothetical protein
MSRVLPQSHAAASASAQPQQLPQQSHQQQLPAPLSSSALVPQHRSLIQQHTGPDYAEPEGPAYCRPIIANLLPEYTNAHAEAIRQAFLPTSFRSIQSLGGAGPSSASDKAAFRASKCNAVFSDFEYKASPFEAEDEARAEERKRSLLKMRRIAGDQEVLAFRTAYPGRRDRFDPLWDTPFLSEKFQEQNAAAMTRERLLRAAAVAGDRPFVPAGVQKLAGRPTRALLDDAMAMLFRSLADDWPDAQPTVLTTAEDLIVVYFPLERIRNADGVTTYMNHALRRNEVVLEFDLRKVVEGWNVRTDDGFALFTLRPPWVRARNFVQAAEQREQAQREIAETLAAPPPPPTQQPQPQQHQ